MAEAIKLTVSSVDEATPLLIGERSSRAPPGRLKRLFSEGHTFGDAFLATTAAQVGQVILTMPHAFSQTGVLAGTLICIIAALTSLWTLFLLAALFLECRQHMIRQGDLPAKDGQKQAGVTQLHDVIGAALGASAGRLTQLLNACQLTGVAIAQILACASNMYYISDRLPKRAWEIIFGGVLMLFTFLPTFRDFRVFNLVALIGTSFTAWYIFGTALEVGTRESVNIDRTPATFQERFVGASLLVSAMGGHSIAMEQMDAMKQKTRFVHAYFLAWLFTFTLTLPHSIAANLAFPDIQGSDNVFGVLPQTAMKQVAVYLMILHQFVAFALYITPLFFMWEKLLGTHNSPLRIRLPTRLPVSLLIWLLAVAFPFYGTLNSVVGAVGAPATAFVLPCIAYNWVYRSQAARDSSPLPPPRLFQLGGWKVAFAVNWLIITVFSAAGLGFFFFSMRTLLDEAQDYGLFPKCFQC